MAEKNRDGEIGHANALKDQRIQVAAADATAIQGENDAKIEVAQSDANRREKEAEALRQATAAEKVQAAMALQEAYGAQQRAEQQRAELVRASQQADIVVKAEIDKQQREIAAEAEAEVTRRKARGEADAIYARMEAQARGVEEILTKQAAGMQQLVSAAGGDPDAAVKFIIADKLEQLVQLQVDAIKNIKIDKVTVWDSMGGENGSPTTANFLSGMLKSIPPMNELFQQAGMSLPNFLGTDSAPAGEAVPAAPEEKEMEKTDSPS